MATMDDWNSISSTKQSVSSPKVVKRQQIGSNGLNIYMEHLLKKVAQTKFGIIQGSIELRPAPPNCSIGNGDRFKVIIPYAHQTLDWTVMFDSVYPELGPDFEFSDKTFLADPDLEIITKSLPSLVNWDHMNRDSLLEVLTELIIHYKQHQIAQLDQLSDRLKIEYAMLLTQTEICEADVELILLPDSVAPEEVHFLIRIAMDYSKLPGKHSVIEKHGAILHVIFHGPNWNRIVPNLYFTKNLEELFGNTNNLHLPPFLQEKNLMDYVPEIKKFINDKMDLLIMTYEKKKCFIETVLSIQPSSILEYDGIEFEYVTFMLEKLDFHFIVHINLPSGFPKDPPKITLQSIYHMTHENEPFKQIIKSIPYSPRWDPGRMIKKALTFIIDEEINKFKNSSIPKKR